MEKMLVCQGCGLVAVLSGCGVCNSFVCSGCTRPYGCKICKGRRSLE